MVRIKFKTKGGGRSLPNGIFETADQYLRILDDANVAYEIISRETI